METYCIMYLKDTFRYHLLYTYTLRSFYDENGDIRVIIVYHVIIHDPFSGIAFLFVALIVTGSSFKLSPDGPAPNPSPPKTIRHDLPRCRDERKGRGYLYPILSRKELYLNALRGKL